MLSCGCAERSISPWVATGDPSAVQCFFQQFASVKLTHRQRYNSRVTPTKTKPKTIAEYIDAAPKETQKKLREMLNCIRAAAPGAEETLKWGMPAFSHQRILVTFAAFKHHIGFFPTPSAVKVFADELSEYKTASASIQFPLDKPLPLALIRKITEFHVKELVEQDGKWRT
jgi:uncharacterized protein YdhG (YjbR/CyaY superfamily)